MKNAMRILALILALTMALSLAACGKKGEPAAQPDGSASSSELAGVVNPIHEVTHDEMVEKTGVDIDAPEEGTDVSYVYIDEAPAIAEVSFTVDGVKWCYRAFVGNFDALFLSGMNYDWTDTTEGEVAYCPAAVSIYDGDEKAACVTWYDVVPDVTYSLSTADSADADLALYMANRSFNPMQGDAEGDVEMPAEYTEVIETVRTAIAEGKDADFYREQGMSHLYSYPADSENPMGYTLVDINEDGVDELILGTGGEYGMIFDLYAMQEGKLVHMANSGERDRYYLCEGGFIRNEGSSGAAESHDIIFAYDGIMLQVVQNVIYDEETDAENPWFLRTAETGEDDPSQPISADEANAKMAEYVNARMELTPFEG